MSRLPDVIESAKKIGIRGYGLRDVISKLYYVIFIDFLSALIGTFVFRLKCLVFGVSAGKKVRCFGPVILLRAPGSRVTIGDNVRFVSRSSRGTAASIYSACKLRTHVNSARIVIGSDVGLNGTSVTARSRTITIGAGTMIGPNVTIVDSDFHETWPPEARLTSPGLENDRDVTIGENVWIGIGSIILKGVTVGDNSVVGAGSVVAKDVPENSLAAGNPAKVIKTYEQVKR